MKIALAGGLGCEKIFLDVLSGHYILQIGGKYLPDKEHFEKPEVNEFASEFLTPNYHNQVSEYEMLIDLSDNFKSKYLMSEISSRYGKIFVTLYYKSGWKFFYSAPGCACFSCLQPGERNPVPFLYPELPLEEALNTFRYIITGNPLGAFSISIPDGRITRIETSLTCPVTKGEYKYIAGEISDIVSVSCGDNTVSVTPTNDFTIDLNEFSLKLEKQFKILKITPFFIEFRAMGFDTLIFRQGRMIVKGTKEKNTGVFIYRKFAGG